MAQAMSARGLPALNTRESCNKIGNDSFLLTQEV